MVIQHEEILPKALTSMVVLGVCGTKVVSISWHPIVLRVIGDVEANLDSVRGMGLET